VHPIIERLADEYADVYVPLNKHFEEALKENPEPYYYSNDGVHPNENGAAFIGKIYAEAIEKLL
jgi:lysophospholipase L1-like esterase